jgi:hypothetical protein
MRAQPDAIADSCSYAVPKSCPHDAVAHGESDAGAFSRPDGAADFLPYSEVRALTSSRGAGG